MADTTRLRSIFHRDPTRDLEEVQKVNATDQAERDVEEFCETESARRVLTELGETLKQDPRHPDPRFLYLHATFGSGKTHLLKLIGYATGETGVPESVVSGLSTRFEGFQRLRTAMEEAPAERLVPVFLNLLDRDASEEPPIPVLIYEAIGTELGYPTDPRWLLEFLFQLEQKVPDTDVWGRLQEMEVQGRSLLGDRGLMRTWLYEAVPEVMDDAGVSCTEDDVRAWISEAEETASDEEFGGEALRDRIEAAQSLLTRRSGERTELLIGLDEIALFIGDDRSRYEELQATMHVLIDGPNPVVLGTGQWGLRGVHADYAGEDPDPEAWYSQEVELEGADTEEIVRRRWLQKKSGAQSEMQGAVSAMPDPPEVLSASPSDDEAAEAYPLRPGDLHGIREAMQSLLTTGRGAATEHIQGRALLVLVRALFVRQGWAEQELGALVPWDNLFAVLRSETNLVPTWAEELLSRLQSVADDTESPVQAVARTVFLLNEAGIDATEEAITHLLLRHVEEGFEERTSEVSSALDALQANKYVFEEADQDPTWYRLLTEQEVSVEKKVAEKADTIAYPRLRSTIMDWMREYGSLLTAQGNRQEVALGGERGVPLTFFYSVLQSVPQPSDHADTVALRVLVGGEVESEIQDWTEKSESIGAREDGLIAVELPANFEKQLRHYVATGDVLQSETRHFPELRSDRLREEQTLREQLRSALDDAQIISAEGKRRGTFADGLEAFVVDHVVSNKFLHRKSLTRALQPIDDGPALAAFFRGEGDWPLSEADARTLGVDLSDNAFREGSWKDEFWAAATDRTSGKIIGGDQVINMIEQRGGAFLGTSVEAIAALLLALATNEDIQLRRDGDLLRDPAEMGRAVRTKTEIRRLTIRLEPPPDRDAVERLRAVHRALTEADATPDDTEEIVSQVAEWAQGHVGAVQQVRQFVEKSFEEVSLGTLADRLQAAAADPSTLGADTLSEPVMKEQVETFGAARRYREGPKKGLWDRFLEVRTGLEDTAPYDLIRKLERATVGEVPSPGTLRSLIQAVEDYRDEEADGVENSGSEGEEFGSGEEEDGETDLEGFTEKFGPDDSEEMKERVDTLLERLDEEAKGQLVVIQKSSL